MKSTDGKIREVTDIYTENSKAVHRRLEDRVRNKNMKPVAQLVI